MRETPSLANGLRTWLSAIGNNVPMMTEEFNKLSKSMDANTGKIVGKTGALKIMLGSIFSWNSALLVVLTVLPLVADGMTSMFNSMTKGTKATLDQSKATADLNEEMKSTGKGYAEAVVKLEILNERVAKGGKSFAEKKEILKDCNKLFGDTLGVAKSYNDVERILREKTADYITAMKLRAQAQAAMNLAVKEQEAILNRQLEGEQQLSNLRAVKAKALKDGQFTGTTLKQYNEGIAAQEKIIKNDVAANEARKSHFEGIFTNLTIEADKIDKALNFNTDPGKKEKDKTYSGSKLDGHERDKLKIAEANQQKAISIENNRILKIRELRELTLAEEIEHLKIIQNINEEAAIKKTAAIVGNGAAEIKARADIDSEVINGRIQTKDKINALNKKAEDEERARNERAFAEESKLLKKQLENQKSKIDLERDVVLQDPKNSEEVKAFAKSKSHEQLLLSTTAYYKELDALALKYKVSNEAIEEEKQKSLTDILKNSLGARNTIAEAGLQDISTANSLLINEQKQIIAARTKAILEDESLTEKQKANQLKLLEKSSTLALFDVEIAGLQVALDRKKALYDEGLINEKSYSDSVTALATARAAKVKYESDQEQSYISKTINSLKEGISNVTDFFKGNKASQKDIDSAIQAGVQTTKSAINEAYKSYFENENKRVDTEKQHALDRLNLEQRQAENVAQSEAEKESIRRQFDEKRKAAEKTAGEEKKQIALKQAAIDFGVAMIKTLAAYPFPFSLIPAAGLTIQYLLQRKNIQAQKFAEGGEVKALNRGRINEPQNIPIQPNGDRVLAMLTPGEVVLNERDQARLGGAKTFSALGLPGFAAGGLIEPIGGFRTWGDNLKPPINPQSYLSPNTNNLEMRNSIDDLMEMTKENAAQLTETGRQIHKRIDKFQVHLDVASLDDFTHHWKRAVAKGTL
jgi:hypothetical protein